LIMGRKMSDLTIVIPGAGASARMRGPDKLLIKIDGVPLLRRTVLIALKAAPRVLVTLREGDAARRGLVQDLPVQILKISDAATGLSASLRAAAASGQGRMMILPADMPDITAQDLALMIKASDAAPDRLVRAATDTGIAGHPVIFPADLRCDFAGLSGDQGARPLVAAHVERMDLIALPAQHAMTDLDTPEAWQAWSQSRQT
jgi:CTP:molybdopterin cytidylyltransferase MocA